MTLALALFGATLAPSAFGHGHPGESGEPHGLAGSYGDHQNGSSSDPHDLTHCSAVACTAVLLPRVGYVQLRLASIAKPIVLNNITTDLSWARLDPPIPR
ncbi:MAG: hypothetical protein OEQ29_10000 [Alphaproteobacteria bacterium]|nr:hypothetical protein [Alphaproteobacteria bacterium]